MTPGASIPSPEEFALNVDEDDRLALLEDRSLGEIYISVPYVERQCLTRHCDINARLFRLLVHSVCHLVGYDHENAGEYALVGEIVFGHFH